MKLLGKEVADTILDEIRSKLALLPDEKRPTLAVLQVGQNAASSTYIRMKRKACTYVGIHSQLLEFPPTIEQKALLQEIQALNQNPKITGILLQLPLPKHLVVSDLLESIHPNKDVDGFHPLNMGRLLLGLETTVPCTPLGIKILLERKNISVEKKRVVIVGRSHIVGLPLAALWMQKKVGANATVTVAHSQTVDLIGLTKEADILVAAVGRPLFIKEPMVKEGAVVIDVGINKVNDQLVGDVDFNAVEKKCSAITPVPRGVGPMTVAMLLHNTVKRCV